MGNICRSPSAEGFFRWQLARAGLLETFEVDSAGTHSYHIGHPPDDRAIREAATFGVDIAGLRARKIAVQDFERFDHIIGMDRHNLGILQRLAPPAPRASLSLMMQYAPESAFDEVPDPYYGSQRDFSLMCQLLEDATAGLLEALTGGTGR
jgi:protein-tyrosine phosphatase